MALVTAVVGLAVASCADEVDEVVDVGPTGAPAITFSIPAPVGDDEPDAVAPCLSIGEDRAREVTLVIAPEEVVLRPPGACGARLQCGRLSLFVDGVLHNESGVASVALLPRKLADPIRDGSPRATDGQPDLLSLRIQVTTDGDAGTPLLDASGDPVEASLDVQTLVDCEP